MSESSHPQPAQATAKNLALSVDSRQTTIDDAEAATQFLLSRIDYERTPPAGNPGNSFKLDRMRDLLARLDDPHMSLPCVHIAGSKGKGSTAVMIAEILTAAGHRTGLFTSPHIENFEERMRIDGAEIPSQRFAELVNRIRPIVEELDLTPLGGPTFFELTTALAWLYFAEEGAEIVVLEVGLGGRLDATNLCRPLVTLITSISRDHTRILGTSLTDIAREKAGIVKQGIPLLTGTTQSEPVQTIREVCAHRSAQYHALDESIMLNSQNSKADDLLNAMTIDLRSPWGHHDQITVPLPGKHQSRNAALAVAACDLLRAEHGYSIDEEAITAGLARVSWPLRIESVSCNPRIILDAAHNEASIAALVETLHQVTASRRVVVFGASRDKDADLMLRQLADAFDEVILTRYLGNPRALTTEELAELAARMKIHCHIAETPAIALRQAQDIVDNDGLICVTGSFFLAAECRALLRH